MGVIEQLYLATDTIHGFCNKTHKVVITINGNRKVYLVMFILCFPNMVFTQKSCTVEIITHNSGIPEIIGSLVNQSYETILWSLFTTHENQKCLLK